MTPNLARIFVQNPFCPKCTAPLKHKIMQVKNIKNVNLFPKDSLVVFNFNSANQISEVLNTLMALGHPPEGDYISNRYAIKPLCGCHKATH